jgi:predicted acyl esterase
MKTVKSSGTGAGERRLNGAQTTGREYRNLSEPTSNIKRTNDVDITMRDGIRLKGDLFQPDAVTTVFCSSRLLLPVLLKS